MRVLASRVNAPGLFRDHVRVCTCLLCRVRWKGATVTRLDSDGEENFDVEIKHRKKWRGVICERQRSSRAPLTLPFAAPCGDSTVPSILESPLVHCFYCAVLDCLALFHREC